MTPATSSRNSSRRPRRRRALLPSSNKASSKIVVEEGQLVLRRNGLAYRAKSYPPQLGRLRATVKVETENRFHVDTLDLYSSRSRNEFGRRVSKALGMEEDTVEADLLALLVEAEKASDENKNETETPKKPTLTEAERKEALSLLKRPDLLDQVSKDIDTLGYVGEEVNKRLLYLVAISRKLADPLSAVILSQSGAGKSGLTEVIERLSPPEDVVLLTRLTPQSLYYVDDGFLDQKLVIIEERYGSMEADYSIRVLQSRKKLIAAAPIKDPQTGNMRTRVFSVEARAAFIEATTASQLNHENATRCFELAMDESIEQTQRIHERQRLMRTESRTRDETESRIHRQTALECTKTFRAASGRHSLCRQAHVSFHLDADPPGSCALPQSHRGLCVPSPVPKTTQRRSHPRHGRGLRDSLSSLPGPFSRTHFPI